MIYITLNHITLITCVDAFDLLNSPTPHADDAIPDWAPASPTREAPPTGLS